MGRKLENDFLMRGDITFMMLFNRHGINTHTTVFNTIHLNKIEQYKWYVTGNRYVATIINGKNILLHRFITECESEFVVDHIDGDGFDNRDYNLRVCTHKENIRNAKLSVANTSGYKGVSWKKDKCIWKAYITVDYKQIHLGYYDDIEDAVKARKEAEIKYFGEFKR